MEEARDIKEVINSALKKEWSYTDKEIICWWDAPNATLDHLTPREYVEKGKGRVLIKLIDPSWE